MSRQYNLQGFNGLYLAYTPTGTVDSTNYLTKMLGDNDFFPTVPSNAVEYAATIYARQGNNSNYIFKNTCKK